MNCPYRVSGFFVQNWGDDTLSTLFKPLERIEGFVQRVEHFTECAAA
jgi:hypothetical protein